MSIHDLVQIGDGQYVIPDSVIRVYVGEPFRDYTTGEIEPATTYVVVATANVMAGLMGGDGKSEQVVCSKWPFERVRAALGLVDATPMHDEFDRLAEGGGDDE